MVSPISQIYARLLIELSNTKENHTILSIELTNILGTPIKLL